MINGLLTYFLNVGSYFARLDFNYAKFSVVSTKSKFTGYCIIQLNCWDGLFFLKLL